MGPLAHLFVHRAQVDGTGRIDSPHPTASATKTVQVPAKQVTPLPPSVLLMSCTFSFSIEDT